MKYKSLPLIGAVVITVLVSFILAYFYIVLNTIIPFVYLNVVFAVLFSASLSYLTRFANRLAHNRIKKTRVIFAILTGLIANYFQWSAFLMYLKFGEIPDFTSYFESIFWIFTPDTNFYIISDLYVYGSWSFFGISFNGMPLVLIWTIEFLIIIYGPIHSILKKYEFPYSEKHSKWFDKFVLDKDFLMIPVAGMIEERIKKNPIECLRTLETGKAERHTKFFIFYLEDDVDAFISVEKVIIGSRSNGKEKRDLVIDKVRIDSLDALTILNQYSHKKETLIIF